MTNSLKLSKIDMKHKKTSKTPLLSILIVTLQKRRKNKNGKKKKK